jgi:hypothetical protein
MVRNNAHYSLRGEVRGSPYAIADSPRWVTRHRGTEPACKCLIGHPQRRKIADSATTGLPVKCGPRPFGPQLIALCRQTAGQIAPVRCERQIAGQQRFDCGHQSRACGSCAPCTTAPRLPPKEVTDEMAQQDILRLLRMRGGRKKIGRQLPRAIIRLHPPTVAANRLTRG